VLNRAEDMQTAAYSEANENGKIHIDTIKLISNCHSKLKNYKKAYEFIQKALEFSLSQYG
jgi:hypothetical protein